MSPYSVASQPQISRMNHWYCCYTSVNSEHIASKGLIEKGFETYLPMQTKVVRHARQQKLKTLPLLSRYLFVKFDIEGEWSWPIRSTDGVETILSNNMQPVEIPSWIISEFKTREAAGEFHQSLPKKTKSRWNRSFEALKQILDGSRQVAV